MSIKTTFKATAIALVLFGAVGFYYFGRGGKLEHGGDTLMSLMVEWDPGTRSLPVEVTVLLNGRESRKESKARSHWAEQIWARPGDTVTLTGVQNDRGYIVCTIHAKGVVHGPDEGGPKAGDACSVVAKAI